jgi:hypothetical protein
MVTDQVPALVHAVAVSSMRSRPLSWSALMLATRSKMARSSTSSDQRSGVHIVHAASIELALSSQLAIVCWKQMIV